MAIKYTIPVSLHTEFSNGIRFNVDFEIISAGMLTHDKIEKPIRHALKACDKHKTEQTVSHFIKRLQDSKPGWDINVKQTEIITNQVFDTQKESKKMKIPANATPQYIKTVLASNMERIAKEIDKNAVQEAYTCICQFIFPGRDGQTYFCVLDAKSKHDMRIISAYMFDKNKNFTVDIMNESVTNANEDYVHRCLTETIDHHASNYNFFITIDTRNRTDDWDPLVN